MVPPKVLVADEISLGLAPLMTDVVYDGLRRINETGTALIIVEQQVDRVLEIAQTAVVLEHGSVAYQGPSAGAMEAVEALLVARERAEADGDRRRGAAGVGGSDPPAEAPDGARGAGHEQRGAGRGRGGRRPDDAGQAGRRPGQLAPGRPAGAGPATLVERTGIDPGQVDDVIGGCVSQVGEQSTNIARNGWVAAGLPQHVPATTVDRQCGSSQQAMHFAAAGVNAGHYDLVVACGVESMSRVKLASNARGGPARSRRPSWNRSTAACGPSSGWPRSWPTGGGSPGRTWTPSPWRATVGPPRPGTPGHFAAEAVPVPLKDEEGVLTGAHLETDEGIRRSGTMEALAGLPPAQSWEPDTAPDITAGNSSQMTDGAAAMLIAERSVAERLGLPVRARFAHATVAADDAAIVLSAPVPATQRLLDRSGMTIDQFDAVECNEAFAAIALMWNRAFPVDPAILNPRGGAIALGHPLGASGVRLAATLLNQLEATGAATGSRPCARAAGRPTPWCSSAWADTRRGGPASAVRRRVRSAGRSARERT